VGQNLCSVSGIHLEYNFIDFLDPSLWEVFSLQLIFMDWIYPQVKALPFLKLTNLTNVHVTGFI